jgi:hypothetical protein
MNSGILESIYGGEDHFEGIFGSLKIVCRKLMAELSQSLDNSHIFDYDCENLIGVLSLIYLENYDKKSLQMQRPGLIRLLVSYNTFGETSSWGGLQRYAMHV